MFDALTLAYKKTQAGSVQVSSRSGGQESRFCGIIPLNTPELLSQPIYYIQYKKRGKRFVGVSKQNCFISKVRKSLYKL